MANGCLSGALERGGLSPRSGQGGDDLEGVQVQLNAP